MPKLSRAEPGAPQPVAAAATAWSCPATVSTAPRAAATGWSARTRPAGAPAATTSGSRSAPDAEVGQRRGPRGVGVDVEEAGAPEQRELADPAAAEAEDDELRQREPLQTGEVEALVPQPEQLEERGDVAEGEAGAGRELVREVGGQGRRVLAAARVVPGDDGRAVGPRGVDEHAGLGHRGEPDRADAGAGGEVGGDRGEELLDGVDEGRRAALDPALAALAPARRHGVVEDGGAVGGDGAHLGDGGAEVEAEVDGAHRSSLGASSPDPRATRNVGRTVSRTSAPGSWIRRASRSNAVSARAVGRWSTTVVGGVISSATG